MADLDKVIEATQTFKSLVGGQTGAGDLRELVLNLDLSAEEKAIALRRGMYIHYEDITRYLDKHYGRFDPVADGLIAAGASLADQYLLLHKFHGSVDGLAEKWRENDVPYKDAVKALPRKGDDVLEIESIDVIDDMIGFAVVYRVGAKEVVWGLLNRGFTAEDAAKAMYPSDYKSSDVAQGLRDNRLPYSKIAKILYSDLGITNQEHIIGVLDQIGCKTSGKIVNQLQKE